MRPSNETCVKHSRTWSGAVFSLWSSVLGVICRPTVRMHDYRNQNPWSNLLHDYRNHDGCTATACLVTIISRLHLQPHLRGLRVAKPVWLPPIPPTTHSTAAPVARPARLQRRAEQWQD